MNLSPRALIEGIIFAASHPVSKKVLKDLLNISDEELTAALQEIHEDFEKPIHGLHLIEVANGYQFRTKAELKELMARFYEAKAPRLTQATLEVLAIISYKQPITRPEIEKIRGVDCTAVLKTLLDRGLIEMKGRAELPGNPVVYGTTAKFLEWFQIRSLDDLPPLAEMDALSGGFDQGTESLLGLLNKDEGLTAESLAEIDQTLKDVRPLSNEALVPWEAPVEAGAETSASQS